MAPTPRITARISNGSPRLVIASLDSKYVSMALVIRSGGTADPPGQSGLAHMAEHVSVAGARGFPAHGLWQHLRAAGGGLRGQTCVDATTFLIWMPADKWQEVLAAIAAIAFGSTHPKSLLESERRAVLDEMPPTRSPASFEETAACYFGSHPYARPVVGTPSSVRALDAGTLEKFRRRHYVRRNSVLVAVGPCDVDALCQAAASRLADMPPGRPAVGPPRFRRPALGPIVRRFRAPRKGGKLSLWLPMPDTVSALLLAELLRMPGGPLQQMLLERGFACLSGTAEAWLARSARTLIVQVEADGLASLGRDELLHGLGNLARAAPDRSTIEAAKYQLLIDHAESMQNGRWVCEALARCTARGDGWPVREAAVSAAADSLRQRWRSLLSLDTALITCAWPENARRRSPAWPAVSPSGHVESLGKKAIAPAKDAVSEETISSVRVRMRAANGAILLAHPSRAPKFTLTAGFMNARDSLPAVLAASGGEGWNRLIRALATRNLRLRCGCGLDYAWLQMTGPREQFAAALDYLLPVVHTPPDFRFYPIAQAWAERDRRLAEKDPGQSIPLRLFAQMFPHQYGHSPQQVVTWEHMLNCWNESFVGCRSVWAMTGGIADAEVMRLADALERLRPGEILHRDRATHADRRRKLLWLNAPLSAVSMTWPLPPEAGSADDLELLRWLLSGSLFGALRTGAAPVYEGGAVYRRCRYGGVFGLYAIAMPWRAAACLRGMRLILAQAHADRFDIERVEMAKAALSASEEELCADPPAWGLELVDREVSGRSVELAASRYQEVSPSTVERALKEHLRLSQAVTVILWPGWRTMLDALSNLVGSKVKLANLIRVSGSIA